MRIGYPLSELEEKHEVKLIPYIWGYPEPKQADHEGRLVYSVHVGDILREYYIDKTKNSLFCTCGGYPYRIY